PACVSTSTSCPAFTSNSTPTGIIATRYSSALISFGTPTFIVSPSVRNSPSNNDLRQHHILQWHVCETSHPLSRHVAYGQHQIVPMQIRDTMMLQANTTPATKPRLLILDEDRIILQSLSQVLRREGYEVKTT